MPTPQEGVEIFHLTFLDHLGRKLEKNLYALKGGCNLRFFLKSIRYSEDIDLDIQTVAKETLQNKVRKILSSTSLTNTLRAKGIEVSDISEPKQTETVQRWKLSLVNLGSSVPIRTKIEFSRRGLDSGIKFEAIDPVLIQTYAMSPILANHYSNEAAYKQKVEALIQRTEIQARDVFDLDLLIRTGMKTGSLSKILVERLEEAEKNALSVTFADFTGQVVAYLKPEYQAQYSSSSVWDDIVLRVIEFLRGENK